MNHDHDQTAGATGFYLMRGGPIYRWMVKLRLHGGENAYVGRRSLLLISVTWLPLLLLSLAQGLALPVAVRLPFFYDFAIHVTYLGLCAFDHRRDRHWSPPSPPACQSSSRGASSETRIGKHMIRSWPGRGLRGQTTLKPYCAGNRHS